MHRDETIYLDVLLQVCFARPDHAEPALFLQSAEGIIIGDPGRDAHATGLGASTPFRGLHQAVVTHHCWVWTVSVLQPVSCKRGATKVSLLPDLNLLKALFPFLRTSGHHTYLWGDSSYCSSLAAGSTHPAAFSLRAGRPFPAGCHPQRDPRSPARAGPTAVCSLAASQTHSSQHFPGSFTWRG